MEFSNLGWTIFQQFLNYFQTFLFKLINSNLNSTQNMTRHGNTQLQCKQCIFLTLSHMTRGKVKVFQNQY